MDTTAARPRISSGWSIGSVADKIRRPLPLNESVVVEFTPKEPATVEFTCGMAMLRGTIVVQWINSKEVHRTFAQEL